MPQIVFGGKFSNLTLWAVFTKILPFRAKYAHFSLFLPNATINEVNFGWMFEGSLLEVKMLELAKPELSSPHAIENMIIVVA